MKTCLKILKKAVASWESFWLGSDSQKQVVLFRRVFGFSLLFFYSIRALDLSLFYGETGLAPVAVFQYLGKLKYGWTILEHVTNPGLLWLLHGLFLLSLFMVTAGIFVQSAAIAAFVLHLTFLHRNFGVAYGADMISTSYLFYLAFCDHRKRPVSGDFRASLGSIAFRFAQIQLCLIYGFSGLAKLKGVLWWQGLALWDVLANSQVARWDLSWASAFPLTISLLTYSTLLWEIYFPVLIWVPKTRRAMLAFGVAFHLGIGTFLTIPFFAAIMIAIYLLFLNDAEVYAIEKSAQKSLNAMQRLFFRTLGVK